MPTTLKHPRNDVPNNVTELPKSHVHQRKCLVYVMLANIVPMPTPCFLARLSDAAESCPLDAYIMVSVTPAKEQFILIICR